jgi:hypothetical protein
MYRPRRRLETSAVALTTALDKPSVPKLPRPRDERAKFDLPENENPSVSIRSAIGHNRGLPEIEQGDI